MIVNQLWDLASSLHKYMLELMVLQLILLLFCLFLSYVCLQLFKFLIRQLASYQMPHLKSHTFDQPRPVIVGFFHPYCNAGGGGERVLWEAIKALQNRYNHVRCVVYSGDISDIARETILERVKNRFNITLPRTDSLSICFIPLQTIKLIEASTYPRFTLIGQSLGSIFLSFEALFKLIPDVYFDSMGYAFTYPIFKYLANRPVACYVHYPTISTDMLQVVSERQDGHNNASFISSSFIFSNAKLIYYKFFSYLYGYVGSFADVVMVNSTWTRGHITTIWGHPSTHLVYPPCNVEDFLKLPLHAHPSGDNGSTHYVTSIAQFRPEKDHKLQLRLFHAFLASLRRDNSEEHERQQLNHLKSQSFKLLLVGSCRGREDELRVEELRRMVEEMGLSGVVEIRLNVSFQQLKELLQQTSVGLHTMWNEHFGIGVVECMAAGIVMLAHNSGGPKADIVLQHQGQKTGFLASDEKSYSEALKEIFCMTEEERMRIRTNARASVARFSDEKFDHSFIHLIHPLIEAF